MAPKDVVFGLFWFEIGYKFSPFCSGRLKMGMDSRDQV